MRDGSYWLLATDALHVVTLPFSWMPYALNNASLAAKQPTPERVAPQLLGLYLVPIRGRCSACAQLSFKTPIYANGAKKSQETRLNFATCFFDSSKVFCQACRHEIWAQRETGAKCLLGRHLKRPKHVLCARIRMAVLLVAQKRHEDDICFPPGRHFVVSAATLT